MKKMINLIIILVFLYLGIQVLYYFLVGSSVQTYDLIIDGTNYNVIEKYSELTSGTDKIKSYYYEINGNNQTYNFRLFNNSFTGIANYLTQLKTYNEGALSCIYPIFKDNKGIQDVICNIDNIQYNYGHIAGKYSGLENFILSLKSLGYIHKAWNVNNGDASILDEITYYKDNIFSNSQLVAWNYKGIYNFGSNINRAYYTLGSNRYENKMGSKVGNYYVYPANESGESFNQLAVIYLVTGKLYTFDLGVNISNNSFVQGYVKDDLFIVDKTNKIQYKINIRNRKVDIVGSNTITAQMYINGLYVSKLIEDIVGSELKFEYDSLSPDGLDMNGVTRVDSIYNQCYYVYYQNGKNTILYRVDKENINKKTLIIDMPNVYDIKYIGTRIYWISDGKIYGYDEEYGLKLQATYNELKNNQLNRIEAYYIK